MPLSRFDFVAAVQATIANIALARHLTAASVVIIGAASVFPESLISAELRVSCLPSGRCAPELSAVVGILAWVAPAGKQEAVVSNEI